jgi:hypothetical protein
MALIMLMAIIFMTIIIIYTTEVTTVLYRLLACSSKKLERNKATVCFLTNILVEAF